MKTKPRDTRWLRLTDRSFGSARTLAPDICFLLVRSLAAAFANRW